MSCFRDPDIYYTGSAYNNFMKGELGDDLYEEYLDNSGEFKLSLRDNYGGFIKTRYIYYKSQHINTGECAHPRCERLLIYGIKTFVEGDPQWGFSIDHKISVHDHYHKKGGCYNKRDVNNIWYNWVDNWLPMHRSCNSRKGASSL